MFNLVLAGSVAVDELNSCFSPWLGTFLLIINICLICFYFLYADHLFYVRNRSLISSACALSVTNHFLTNSFHQIVY